MFSMFASDLYNTKIVNDQDIKDSKGAMDFCLKDSKGFVDTPRGEHLSCIGMQKR